MGEWDDHRRRQRSNGTDPASCPKPLAGTILIKKFGDLKQGPLLILIERNSEYEIAFEAFLCCFAWSADTNAYVDREQVAPVRRPPVVEIGVEGAPPLIEALVDLDFGIFGRELQELKPETIRLNLLRGEPVFLVPPPSFPRPPVQAVPRQRSSSTKKRIAAALRDRAIRSSEVISASSATPQHRADCFHGLCAPLASRRVSPPSPRRGRSWDGR